MINILSKKDDDIRFTRIVNEILATLLSRDLPTKAYMGFKGKFMGAAGAWNHERLRIPPFNPKKIVEELYFEKLGNDYVESDAPKLHVRQRIEFSHERRIENIGKSALYLWYSGETLVHPHASVMVYAINNARQSSWFASFICKNSWRIAKTRGISEQEAHALFEKTFVGI